MGAVVFAAVAVLPGIARADDKQACSAAYEQAQSLRQAGKLSSARAQTAVCVRDVCADFIRADCAKWLGEIDASQPTVVVAAQDVSGADTLAVRVLLDGKVLATTLDGKSIALDPGPHTMRFELAGVPPIEQSIVVVQGTKDRRIEVSFKTGAGSAASANAPGRADLDAPAKGVPVWAWGVGGAGVGLAAVGAVLVGVAVANKGNLASNSPDSDVTKVNDELLAGGLLAGVGLVGVVVGIIGVATAPKAATAQAFRLVPVVATSRASIYLQGEF